MDQNPIDPVIDIPAEKAPWWEPMVSKTDAYFGENPFLSSFLTAILFVMPILLLFRLYFQWDDDYYAVLLLKGIGLNWAPSEFNYMENAFLCLVLKNLYIKFPAVQWYSALFVLINFLSIWAILAAFNLGTNRFFKTLLFILSAAVLEVRFMGELQWTLVAASAGIGGILLLVAIWKREDSKYLLPALGLVFVLAVFSVLIRPSSLLLAIAGAVPAVVFLARKTKITSHRTSILFFLAAVALTSLIAVTFDNTYYSRNQAWGGSEELYHRHGELCVFRNPVYDETSKPIFDMVGWSQNDRNLMLYNYFMDPETYSAEKLQTLNRYFPRVTFDKNPQDTFSSMFANPGFSAAFLFFLALLPLLSGETLWFVAFNTAWTVLILLFCRLYLWMPERIYLPFLFLQNNFSIFWSLSNTLNHFKNSSQPAQIGMWKLLLLVFYFIFTVHLLELHYSSAHAWAWEEKDLKVAMSRLNPQDDQVFVTWGGAFPYIKIGAFDDDEFLRHFHTIALDWFQRTPINSAMMSHYDLKNLFKDLVDNPKAFLIADSDELNLYRIYMKEKYNQEINFKVYLSSGPFTALSIHSVSGKN